MGTKRPIIAISSGDPAGIGPEICIKALNYKSIYDLCKPLIVSDSVCIKRAIDFCGLKMEINIINSPEKGKYTFGIIDVLEVSNINVETFEYGKVCSNTGEASFEYVTKVIELALQKKVQATVTGPISKEAIRIAGHNYAGHTEIFAEYTKTSAYAMLLADKNFRVIHVNTHKSMLNSIYSISKEKVLSTILLADEGLKRMGIKKPRIAVNGLNPHAGENGLFGQEEIEHIIPAIQEAQNNGIIVDGPHPPDTIFPKMQGGQYDCVVCMYHDQGHIPTKLIGFTYNHVKKIWEGMSGVNITLGLPIIRVSVDHGTAFDKAGKNEANPESMMQAIYYATKFSTKIIN